MTVTINKTDGTVLTTIADGSADTNTTNIALIGRLYKNYGELINENLVKLLENFANSTSPTAPIIGQLWYDKSTKTIKAYRDTGFVPLARITSTASEPSNPVTSDLWYDLTDAQLKIYSGGAWVVIAPGYTASQNKTGAFAENIQDVTTANHVAVVIRQQNIPVVVISKDPEYTPMSALSGFTSIKPGVNLSSISGFYLQGTSSNADKLDNLDSTQFIRSDADSTLTGNLKVSGSTQVGTGTSNLKIAMDSTTAKITHQGVGNLQFLMDTDLAAVINSNEQILVTNGLVTAPSISFIDNVQTGFYKPAANTIGVAIQGLQALTIGPTGAHAYGDFTIAGNVRVVGTSSFDDDITANTKVHIKDMLTVDGDVTIGLNPTVSTIYINADTIDIPNDLTFTTGDVTVNGFATFKSGLSAGDTSADSSDFTGNVSVVGNLSVTGNTTITGVFSVPVTDSNDFKIDASGRVLVNSTSPATGYDHEGDISMGSNSSIDNGIYARNVPKHVVTFNGTLSGLAIYRSHHVRTVTRTTTGTYTITLQNDYSTSTPLTSAYPTIIGSVNGAGSIGYNSTISAGDISITIYTYNAAGTLADFSRVNIAIWDGAN